MGGETPIDGHWDTLSRIQQRAYMIRSWYDFRQASLMAQLVKKKKKKKKKQCRRTQDTVSITRLGRSPGGGNGNPLHYSCLKNPMVRVVWQATVHRVTELDTTE